MMMVTDVVVMLVMLGIFFSLAAKEYDREEAAQTG
jgi:hypothetical protein